MSNITIAVEFLAGTSIEHAITEAKEKLAFGMYPVLSLISTA